MIFTKIASWNNISKVVLKEKSSPNVLIIFNERRHCDGSPLGNKTVQAASVNREHGIRQAANFVCREKDPRTYFSLYTIKFTNTRWIFVLSEKGAQCVRVATLKLEMFFTIFFQSLCIFNCFKKRNSDEWGEAWVKLAE